MSAREGLRGTLTGRGRRRSAVGAWLGIGLSILLPRAGAAEEWRWGEVQLSLDSFFSISSSIRTQEPDCRLVASVNGGCNRDAVSGDFLFAIPGLTRGPGSPTEGQLLNGDDANLNWDQWDVFSVLVKGSHDVKLDWRNYGVFVRFSYFADLIQIDPDATQRTDLVSSARSRSNNWEGGVVGWHFQLLDAFVHGSWSIADRYVDLRIGNQVVSWGEGIFTQGGVNSVNSLDVTKIRLPGTELKEALLPAPMVRLGLELWGPLSLEAYYQFGWRRTDIDPLGSFFSASDLAGRGTRGFHFPLGCGDLGTPIEDRTGTSLIPFACSPDATGIPDDLTLRFPLGIPFLGTEEAKDYGQWGVALRYYASFLETEFGLYYIRLHDKYPTVSFRGSVAGLGCLDPSVAIPSDDCDIGYFHEFKENIDLVGWSFNTVIRGIAVGGEVSYRWRQPTPVVSNPRARISGLEELSLDLGQLGGPGGTTSGSVREQRLVAMLNGIWIIGPGTPWLGAGVDFVGASDLTWVMEVGVTHYPHYSLLGADPLRNGREFYAVPLEAEEASDTGYGYQTRISLKYDRFLGFPVTFTPTVAFRHDVHGVLPSGEAAYNEDLMQLGVILEVNYQQRWIGTLSYSNSFGIGIRNGNRDRDFAGVSLQYAF